MIQIGEYIIIELPEGAKGVHVDLNVLTYIHDGEFKFERLSPYVAYTIEGKAMELSEGKCSKLVTSSKVTGLFNDYECDLYCFRDAVGSLKSLIRSHKISPENSWVLKTK